MSPQPIVIGNQKNFWLYNPSTSTFDLTHPPSPTSPACPHPLAINTTTNPILIDPSKSALVIIDMQNYFLAPCLGRPATSPGHAALTQLKTHAIPAARKGGIRIVWLNWGLTEGDLRDMPPAVGRAFGFGGRDKFGVVREGGGRNGFSGLGSVFRGKEEEEGRGEDVGRLLMRGSWNADVYGELKVLMEEGDVWVHKNRMSGMSGDGSELEEVLGRLGIRTLLFAGVNTDQCVGGTYQDCFSKGYDCILLSDGCGTTSPAAAQQCVEYNAANTHGFCTSCEMLAEGVRAQTEGSRIV